MRGTQSVKFGPITATTAAFALDGGVYVMDANATWGGGSVTLQRLGPNGSTYITAVTALAADGTTDSVALPPGQYKVAVATATAVYVSVTRVPGE